MIYLIGGPPRCGKSTVAKVLSEKTGIPWISTDAIECMVKPYISAEVIPELFPKSYIRELTASSNERMYTEYSAEEIALAYLKQGEVTHNAIDQYLLYLLANEGEIIIEGYHLLPAFVSRLVSRHSQSNIGAIYMTKSKTDDFIDTICADKSSTCWVKNKSVSRDIYPKVATMLSLLSRKISAAALSDGLTVVEYRGDFQDQVSRGVASLTKLM